MALELYRRRHPVYWRPSFGLRGLQEEMNRMFSDFFDESSEKGVATITPAIDLVDGKDKVTVRVEIPGMDKDDVQISLKEDMLVIRGEKKAEKEEKEENRYYVERSYGSFMRTVALPSRVKADEVKASYKDGVLKIELPKAEEDKIREVKVQVS